MLCIQGSPLYQWDRNRRLEIDSKDIGTNFEIHCCHKDDDDILTVEPIIEGDTVVVNIPNILLQKSGFLRVYVVSDGDTVYDSSFYIIARPKPADYVYTETEVKTWEQFEERLGILEKSVAEGIPDEQIAEVVESYMIENGVNGTDDNAVHYTSEEKTEEERSVARDNIGAASVTHDHPTDTSRMESAEGMATITALQTSDSFILYDLPGKTMAKLTWDNLRKLILTYMNGRVVAGSTASVSDEAETGFAATIPELEDDTVLLTEQDMPRIVKAVKDELAVWEGGSY